MLGLRAAPKEDTGVSSAELAFGAALTLPGELLVTPEASTEALVEQIRSGFSLFQPMPGRRQAVAASEPQVPPSLQDASYVYILRGAVAPTLEPKYQGPYLVLEKYPKYFKVAVGSAVETVTVDRLKGHRGCSPVQPAPPPRRGRPPGRTGRGRGRPPVSSASTPAVEEAGGE
jgi:hypothetical protein